MTRGTRAAVVAGAALLIVGAVVPLALLDSTVEVQLLAINDFHGALEPPIGGTGRIDSRDAGGIEYLTTHLARLRATNPNTLTVAAGDNIGATPLLSSLSHDEASVDALNLAGLQLSALGNHDLDEGWWELYRIQKGGCHPVDGCQDGSPFAGARFSYLAANVTLDPRKADPKALALAGVQGTEPRPLLPGYVVREVGGVRIGVIGLILQQAAPIIIASSIQGLTFGPEAEAANAAAAELRPQGVRAIVVVMHQGGERAADDVNGCDGISRDLVALVERMSDDIDVIVSGHSHFVYNCTIDGKIVTSASSNGRVVTDIDLRIQRTDGEVVSKSATNIVVTRDVPKDGAQTALLARYAPAAEKAGARVVGTIEGSLTREANEAGESSLGDVLADALLDAAARVPDARADVAFLNSGGIRADLVATSNARRAPVTYAQLFTTLPFGNELIVKSLPGSALLDVLEQQFGAERVRILQISRGFTYAYDTSRPRGSRVDRQSVRINGAPLDSARTYRVATSNFLWGSGDGLSAMASGTDPITVGVDVDVVADYFMRHSPLQIPPRDRIRRAR